MNTKATLHIALSSLAIGLAGCSASAPSTPTTPTPTASSTPSAEPASSWQLVPAHGAADIKAAGLAVLLAEGSAEHYHAHLDVIADGKVITVPADIGFSFGANGQPNGISALHTHDDSGIIHVEAPTAGQTYTLGQVLTEWGVLDGTSSTPGSAHSNAAEWTVYVNGSKQAGNPRDLTLAPHAEIVLVHGGPPSSIPSSYSFPPGV